MKHTGSAGLRLFFAAVLLSGAASAFAANVRIEHVTVISPERSAPLRDATVIVRDERISSIGPSAQAPAAAAGDTIIDGKGLYLAPGLIDSHVHLSDVPGMRPQDEQAHSDVARGARAQMPRSFLLYGFTTLVDLISSPEQMAQWNANPVHPDTYFCGSTSVIGGYGMSPAVPAAERFKVYPYILVQAGQESSVPKGVDVKRHRPDTVVKRMKADGARCVKMFSEDGFGASSDIPTIPLDIAKAVVRAAHEAQLPVFMHANAAEHQQFALDAGVDVIAHGMWHWGNYASRATVPLSSEPLPPTVKAILDEVIARHVGYQPTLQVLYGERDLFDASYLTHPALARVYTRGQLDWYGSKDGQWFHDLLAPDMPPPKAGSALDAVNAVYVPLMARVARSAAYVSQHNGLILFGTDTPSAPSYANPPGLNGLLEMRRLVGAGLTPAEIFRAATISNARILRLENEVGTVQPGMRANLLLLRADPTQTVEAYADIAKIIVAGKVLEPKDLTAN